MSEKKQGGQAKADPKVQKTVMGYAVLDSLPFRPFLTEKHPQKDDKVNKAAHNKF